MAKETKKTTAKAKKTKEVINVVNPELLEEGTDLNAITPSNIVETMFPREEEKDVNPLTVTTKPKTKKERKLSQAEIEAKAAMERAKAALKRAREDAKAEAAKKRVEVALKKPEKKETEIKKAMTRIESVVAAIKANAELRKDTKELAKVADVLFVNAGGVTNEKESFVNARMTLKVLEAWEKA